MTGVCAGHFGQVTDLERPAASVTMSAPVRACSAAATAARSLTPAGPGSGPGRRVRAGQKYASRLMPRSGRPGYGGAVRVRLVDFGAAAIPFLLGLLGPGRFDIGWALPLSLAFSVPLYWGRRYPLPVLLVTFAAGLIQVTAAVTGAESPARLPGLYDIGIILAMYFAVSYGTRRVRLIGRGRRDQRRRGRRTGLAGADDEHVEPGLRPVRAVRAGAAGLGDRDHDAHQARLPGRPGGTRRAARTRARSARYGRGGRGTRADSQGTARHRGAQRERHGGAV